MPAHLSLVPPPAPSPQPTHPSASVGVVVWRDGQVLLVRRRDPPCRGRWRLPGGRQKAGELLEDAAVRHVREMTGIDIVPIGVVTALDIVERDAEGALEHHVTLIELTAFWRDGEISAHEGALEAKWVYPEELGDYCACTDTIGVVYLSILQGVH